MRQFSPALILLLTATLLKGVITSIVVPLWEFPDEQAHFAQLQHYVEIGPDIIHGRNVSQELYLSQQVMGTLRDQRGHNLYTYAPHYRPQYSSTFTGPDEYHLKNLDPSTRTQLLPKDEAPRYPPLFYHLTSIGYRLVYPADIFTRVFFSRLISVLLTTAGVFIAYQIGLLLSPKKHLFALALATAVSFHPMYSFVSSGINNDNGANFLGLLTVFLTFYLFKKGLSLKWGLAFGTTVGLGFLTKPNVLPAYLPVFLVIGYQLYQTKSALKSYLKPILAAVSLAILAGGWFFLIPFIQTGKIPFVPTVTADSSNPNLSFISYLIPQLGRYYRETLVWYWGIFKWLGVIMPLNVYRIIKVFMILSGFGLILSFIRPKPFISKPKLTLLISFSLIFFAVITFWDYQMIRSLGFSHGLQGRYFFPIISTQMALLVFGLTQLVPKKLASLVLKLTIILFIILHTISLHTLATAYYDTTHLTTFVQQISQYKPWFLKSPYLIIWISLYTSSVTLFITHVLDINTKKD